MDPLDELYAQPPEQFVAARDALAKELKRDGEAERSAEVKALRRPSAVAWAINQAVREHPDALRDLLAAGAALRRAHARLVAGTVDREALRSAMESERAAVGILAAATAEAAQAARRPLTPGGLDKVRETLHAAALDDGVRAGLEAGRLEREASAAGTGAGAAAIAAGGRRAAKGAEPGDTEPARRGGEDGETRGRPPRQVAGARDPGRARRAGAGELRLAREAATTAVRDATRALRAAEREAEIRARRVEIARQARDTAEQALAAAEAELAAAEAALDEGQRELRRTKGAAAAAQAGLDEAQGRLRGRD
jgi:hypothetical protein